MAATRATTFLPRDERALQLSTFASVRASARLFTIQQAANTYAPAKSTKKMSD